jgi:chromosome segregation ATPase
MKYFKFLILSLTLLTACVSYEDEQKEVKELQDRVTAIDTKIEQINVPQIIVIREGINSELAEIKETIDSLGVVLELDDMIFMQNYKMLTKPLKPKRFERVMSNVNIELEISKKQITDLANDVENKAIDKEQLKTFLRDEDEALKVIETKIEEIAQKKETLIAGQKNMRAKVDTFVKELYRK